MFKRMLLVLALVLTIGACGEEPDASKFFVGQYVQYKGETYTVQTRYPCKRKEICKYKIMKFREKTVVDDVSEGEIKGL